jgi:hypothetical protein
MDSETKMNILPVKYSKFATFAYWFLDQLKTSRIIEEDSYTAICEFTHLTDGEIPLQVAFYERFLAEYDCFSKMFKALNKKPKAGKNKKPSQEKKTKTKKNNNSFNANLDIISQVVLRANSVEDDFDLTTPAVSLILQDVASTQEDDVCDTSVAVAVAAAPAEEEPKEKKEKEKKVKEPKEPKEKKVKEPKEPKEKKVKEPKEPKEKKAKEPKEPKEKKAKGGGEVVIKESEPKSVIDLVTTTQQEPQVNNIVLIEEEIPVVEARKNTPILVEKKEKKVKEPREKKEKKVKEPKEKKEKKVKEPKEKKEKKVKEPKEKKVKKVKEPKEKKSKKNGENKEEEKPVFDSEEECAPTTINTHPDNEENPSQLELSVSDEIEEGNKEENDDDDDEEDVDLYVVMVDGVEYYYDIAKNLYNQEQIIIGTFDPVTKDISYFEEK